MNTNKKPNTPQVNISSFVTAPMNSIKNMVNDTKNASIKVKNSLNSTNSTNSMNSLKSINVKKSILNTLPSDISEPINESITQASSFMSLSLIILIGILIISLIIVVIFRTQIAIALETLWGKIKDWYSPKEIPVQPPPEFVPDQASPVEKIMPSKKEVFNVAQDKYTYSDAEPLCKAFGAELATYDQVKDAWEKGADWCNYGWVKGQAAIYPTQKETYDKLQYGPEDQKAACGITGINGGFFDNPELKFGVNCYGTRPGENDTDSRAIMSEHNLTPGGLEYDKKVREYKSEMGHIPINPFKPGTWS